jgi:hypothetical protein
MVDGGPGGIDLFLEGKPRPGDMGFLVYKVVQHWDKPVKESIDGEVFIYRDSKAAAAWMKYGLVPETEGTMVHLLQSDDCMTIVVDAEMEDVAQGWLDELERDRG